MSVFNIQINFDKTRLTKDFLNNFLLNVAKTFDEDTEDVSGSLIEDCNIFWNGSTEPAMYVTVQSVQFLDEKLNRKCAEILSKYLTQASGISESRIFINFVEKVPSDVALNGSLLWQSS